MSNEANVTELQCRLGRLKLWPTIRSSKDATASLDATIAKLEALEDRHDDDIDIIYWALNALNKGHGLIASEFIRERMREALE